MSNSLSKAEIDAAVWVEKYLGGTARFGWHLGLDRIAALLAGLDHPEAGLPVVHVAGTNGKGSVSAGVASILAASGLRVGLFTSPHLIRYTERVTVVAPDGRRDCTFRELMSGLRRVQPVAERVGQDPAVGAPTEFEILTAAALLLFREADVDVAVLETGLGGRLDATSAVPSRLAVITHIDLDHTDRLGPDIVSIAGEKAGIIKAGQRVVVGPQYPEALAVLRRAAGECNARLTEVTECGPGLERPAFRVESLSLSGSAFTFWPEDADAAPLTLHTPLLGRHQVENAAVAAAAGWAAAAGGWAPVTRQTLATGLAATRWPARLELVRHDPPVLVDGAHNPDGMRRLIAALEDLLPGKAPVVVCGFLGDKAVAEMARLLAPHAAQVITTRPASPRAADPADVAALFRDAGLHRTAINVDPGAAAAEGLRQAEAEGRPLVGCGSLYLVGALRTAWLAP